MNKILVVDDELSIRESFSLILEGKYKVLLAASGEGALKTATDQKVDVVYLDIRMPGLDGLETLKRLKEIDPDLEIIMVTAVNDVQKASEAIKLGARDYIVKPFDVNAVLKMTESMLRRKELLIESKRVLKEAEKKYPQLIGQSEKIVEIFKTIDKIAARDLRVLILGEAGTEKEAVARLIHDKSNRNKFAFLSLDLHPQMSRSEIKARIFGAGKGGTTVALKKITGLLEEARGGTVFLNNVECLPRELLVKQSFEARLIAGSNLTDLSDSHKELFDFFSEVLITIPPLRERIADLPLLANYFLEKYNEKHEKDLKEIAPAAMEALSSYNWPGNTAELESLLERMVITAPRDLIALNDLPLEILMKVPGAPGGEYLSHFEKEYTQRIYDLTGKNKAKTAAVLGISPILLEEKI